MKFYVQYTRNRILCEEAHHHESQESLTYNVKRRQGVDKDSVIVQPAYEGKTTYGYWIPLVDPDTHRGDRIPCECICGTVRRVLKGKLQTGKSKSCGCKKLDFLSAYQNTPKYSFEGKELTLGQWSLQTGISYKTLANRLNMGWTIEKALVTPVRTYVSVQKKEE